MTTSHPSIALLVNPFMPSMQELQAVARDKGLRFDQIPHSLISITNTTSDPLFQQLLAYDIIVIRRELRDSIGYELANLLTEQGKVVINAGQKHPFAHRKIQQAILAQRYGIPHPHSYWGAVLDYETVRERLGGQLVIKPDSGAHGTDVALISSQAEFVAYMNGKNPENYILQEALVNSEEYRVYTAGAAGIASYKKVRGTDEFRANLHTNGSVEKTEPELEPMLLDFAGSVAYSFGAEFSGVDVLVVDGKPIFLELNWQPGWQHITDVVDQDIPSILLDHILQQVN